MRKSLTGTLVKDQMYQIPIFGKLTTQVLKMSSGDSAIIPDFRRYFNLKSLSR